MLKFLILSIFIVTPVLANDEGLYDDLISDQYSYIRIYNKTNDMIKPTLNSAQYPELSSGNMSPYYPEEVSTINIGSDFSEKVKTGKFYTLVFDENIFLFEDERSENKTKAVLSFYNLSKREGLKLKANNSISVFEGIEAYSYRSREINSAKVDLQIVTDDDVTIDALENIILERNSHYSVVYDGEKTNIFEAKIDHKQ